MVDVLVAKGEIGIGQNITKDELRWQTWPTAAAGSFIRRSDKANAIEQIAGSVARTPFADGEPIREDKLGEWRELSDYYAKSVNEEPGCVFFEFSRP